MKWTGAKYIKQLQHTKQASAKEGRLQPYNDCLYTTLLLRSDHNNQTDVLSLLAISCHV